MVSTCNSEFEDDEVIRNCLETPGNDNFATIPVVDNHGINFRNIFCARCNFRDVGDVIPWTLNYTCDLFGITFDIDEITVVELFEFLPNQCKIRYDPPQQSNTIAPELSQKSCLNLNAFDETHCYESHPAYSYCANYTAYMVASTNSIDGYRFFKNPHCYLCYLNLASFNDSSFPRSPMVCDDSLFPGYGLTFPLDALVSTGRNVLGGMLLSVPFSVLFDFGTASRVRIQTDGYVIEDSIIECPEGKVHDAFQDTCRTLTCPDGMIIANNECVHRSDRSGHRHRASSCLSNENITLTLTVTSLKSDFVNLKPCNLFIEEIFGMTGSDSFHTWYEDIDIVITTLPLDSKLVTEMVDRIDYYLTINSSNENLHHCNVLQMILTFGCNDISNISACEEGSTIENFSNLDEIVNLIELATQIFPDVAYHLKYARRHDTDYLFNKSVVASSCNINPGRLVCPLESFNKSLFRFSDSGDGFLEHIPTGRQFGPDEFIIEPFGYIQICSNSSTSIINLLRETTVFRYTHTVLSFIGTICSLVGCFMSLLTICLFKELRNRASPLVGNFIVALHLQV